TATAQVNVNNVAPALSNLTLSATTISENDAVTLNGTFTDPGTLDTHTVTIDWGDSGGIPDTDTLQLAAGVLSFQATHRYLDNPAGTPLGGIFPIHVAVTDKDGDFGTADTGIVVNNATPNVKIIGDNVNTTPSHVFLNSMVVEPGTLDTLTYAWTAINGATVLQTGSLPTFDFLMPAVLQGNLVVTLIVADKDGAAGQAQSALLVLADGDYSVSLDNTSVPAGSSNLIVFANEGNKTIDASGVSDSSISLELDDGTGNSTLVGGAGSDIIRGGQ